MIRDALIGFAMAIGRSPPSTLKVLGEREMQEIALRLAIDVRRSEPNDAYELERMLSAELAPKAVSGSLHYWRMNPQASIVTEEGGMPIAVAIFRAHRSLPNCAPQPFLYQIVVASSHRGAGLGRKMLQAAMSGYATLDYRQMFLMVEDAAPASRLYLSLGFRRWSGVAWKAGSSFFRVDLGNPSNPHISGSAAPYSSASDQDV